MSFAGDKSTLVQKHGFLLTRQAYDCRHGIEISLWLKTAQGPVNVIVPGELALFFVEQQVQSQAQQCLKHHLYSLGSSFWKMTSDF